MLSNKYLYIAQWNFSLGNGISNKIASQVEALGQINPTDLCLIEDDKLSFNGESIILKNNSLLGRLVKYNALYSIIKKNNYDFLYVRHIPGFNSVLFFLITLLVKNKNKIKINIEIPTYPFSGEDKSSRLNSFINHVVEKNYKRTINSITYMGTSCKKIWGINAIEFDNGVCIENYKLLEKKQLDDCLHIIGVGSLDYWHGYDRIINGIAESEVKVIFHVVGDGKEFNALKALANKLGVDKNVIFYGKLHSDRLDAVFNAAHLAIDSLGRHRSGNNYNSSIKSKEYTARGIPFIQSHLDKAFLNANFVLKIPADETNIKFDEIIHWYNNMNVTPVDIRSFAIKHFQWQSQFENFFSLQIECSRQKKSRENNAL